MYTYNIEDFKLKIGTEADKIPGYLLWQVSKLWQRHLNAALKDLHLSSTQAVILINIPRLKLEHKAITQMMLSKVTNVDRMTVSQSIRVLEHKQLIRRVVPSGNKRAYHVDLTDTGRKVAMQAIGQIITCHNAFFRQPESDTDAFVTYMQRLIRENKL